MNLNINEMTAIVDSIKSGENMLDKVSYEDVRKYVIEKHNEAHAILKEVANFLKKNISIGTKEICVAAERIESTNNGHLIKFRWNGNVTFAVDDINDPAKMYAYYQELEKFVAEQREIAQKEGINLGTSEIFSKAQEELEQGQEQYAELKTLFEENQAIQAEISALETTIDYNGQEKTVDDIKSLAEYEKFLSEYTKNYAQLLLRKKYFDYARKYFNKLASANNDAALYLSVLQ